MNGRIDSILSHQDGVISRRQVIEAGGEDHEVRRWVRRNEWARALPGVYVNHTGPLTWHQRAWAGVLYAAPAALSLHSARRAVDGPGRRGASDDAPIDIAVASGRAPRDQPGVRIHRVRDFESTVLWAASPPRQRPEEVAIDLAESAANELDAVAYIADAVNARLTTPDRLRRALERRARVRRRRFLRSVIADVAAGTCSVLERGYLTLVERPHGLPTAQRQVRESIKGTVYRDVEYAAYSRIFELDGRLGHDSLMDRDGDFERDLDVVLTGRITARLGWGQVYVRPCRTARKVGELLNAGGWRGAVRSCPRCG